MNNWMQLWIATSKLHSLSQEDNLECPEYEMLALHGF